MLIFDFLLDDAVKTLDHLPYRARQTARIKRKAQVAQFRVFELNLEGPHSHRDASPTILIFLELRTPLGKEKRPPDEWPAVFKVAAPHSGHLRNFFLTPTTEMLSFFQQMREAP